MRLGKSEHCPGLAGGVIAKQKTSPKLGGSIQGRLFPGLLMIARDPDHRCDQFLLHLAVEMFSMTTFLSQDGSAIRQSGS
jgi:hypothetical protein